MAKYYSELNEFHVDFIRKQKIFFVGSSGPGRNVNVSPKGVCPLRVLGWNEVAYLDLYGSGNRTAEDILEGEEDAMILWLYCQGKIVSPSDSQYSDLINHWGEESWHHVRQILHFNVCRVHESCGYGLPVFKYISEKNTSEKLFKMRG